MSILSLPIATVAVSLDLRLLAGGLFLFAAAFVASTVARRRLGYVGSNEAAGLTRFLSICKTLLVVACVLVIAAFLGP